MEMLSMWVFDLSYQWNLAKLMEWRGYPQQIAKKCRSVQPKIQKWIEESAENDPGAMGSFLIPIVSDLERTDSKLS
jgi:hypothetical protein